MSMEPCLVYLRALRRNLWSRFLVSPLQRLSACSLQVERSFSISEGLARLLLSRWARSIRGSCGSQSYIATAPISVTFSVFHATGLVVARDRVIHTSLRCPLLNCVVSPGALCFLVIYPPARFPSHFRSLCFSVFDISCPHSLVLSLHPTIFFHFHPCSHRQSKIQVPPISNCEIMYI